MISRHLACELSVLAGLCVLVIFLFPAVQGPYSATQGPVTELQAVRAAVRVRTTIQQNALDRWRNCFVLPLTLLFWVPPPSAEFQPVALPQCDPILRC
jgi:hypothetical protein